MPGGAAGTRPGAASGTTENMGSSGSTAGASNPMPSSSTFQEIDRNRNGFVDRNEAEAAGLDFHAIDADGDGQVSNTEFEAATRPSDGAGPEAGARTESNSQSGSSTGVR